MRARKILSMKKNVKHMKTIVQVISVKRSVIPWVPSVQKKTAGAEYKQTVKNEMISNDFGGKHHEIKSAKRNKRGGKSGGEKNSFWSDC